MVKYNEELYHHTHNVQMHIEETRRFTSAIAREVKMFEIELLIELVARRILNRSRVFKYQF